MVANKVRRLVGPREKVTEGWRKLHIEELLKFSLRYEVSTVDVYPEDGDSRFLQNISTSIITWCINPGDQHLNFIIHTLH
jgi:hypothetical protein